MLCNYFIGPFTPEILLFAWLTNPEQSHKTTFVQAPLALIMKQLHITLLRKQLGGWRQGHPFGVSAFLLRDGYHAPRTLRQDHSHFSALQGHLLPQA